jgi:hypothetical protein
VRLVADEPALTVLVAGRRIAEARAFCGAVPAQATLVPFAFDREGDVAAQLATAKPDVLVDASGPFQNYRGDPYRVAKGCVAARVHSLDLVDATAFVTGIAALDAAAKAAGVVVLSGASTFPVLSHAAMRRLSDSMGLDDIAMGIAQGRATVERGRGILARMIAAAMRFPEEGDDVPVMVRFDAKDDRETWTRTFADVRFPACSSRGATATRAFCANASGR